MTNTKLFLVSRDSANDGYPVETGDPVRSLRQYGIEIYPCNNWISQSWERPLEVIPPVEKTGVHFVDSWNERATARSLTQGIPNSLVGDWGHKALEAIANMGDGFGSLDLGHLLKEGPVDLDPFRLRKGEEEKLLFIAFLLTEDEPCMSSSYMIDSLWTKVTTSDIRGPLWILSRLILKGWGKEAAQLTHCSDTIKAVSELTELFRQLDF